MPVTWNKAWVWTKLTFLAATVLLIVIFIVRNYDAEVEPAVSLVFVTYKRPRLLIVLLLTVAVSIFGWWMMKVVYRTMRQLRHASDRSRTERLEREMADMKAKAAMLRTSEAGAAGGDTRPPPGDSMI